MGMGAGQVQFGTPDRGRSTPTSNRGRVCQYDDCPTVLSIYNHSDWCSVHEQPDHRNTPTRSS
jgi:hypothetical protein